MSAPRLQPGEQIIFTAHPSGWATSGYYIWTLGLWAFWRNATTFTVTDRRVIQAKGRITKSVRSGPLPMVQDATVKTSLGAGSVILSSAGGSLSVEKFGPMRAADAHALADAILAQCAQARQYR